MNCCEDWEPQTEIILGMIGLREARELQGVKPFVFCPWCGARRSSLPPADFEHAPDGSLRPNPDI